MSIFFEHIKKSPIFAPKYVYSGAEKGLESYKKDKYGECKQFIIN